MWKLQVTRVCCFQAFNELDELNSKRMTKNMMIKLLKQ